MKKLLNTLTTGVALVVVSITASVGTVYVLDKNKTIKEEQLSPKVTNLNPDNGYGFQETNFDNTNYGASKPDLIAAAESSVRAVVHIRVEAERQVRGQAGMIDPFDFFFGGGRGAQQMQSRPVVGFGSGVIISSDGYIMTNNHVVDSSDKISVTLNDNRTLPAKLIGTDPTSDIALIKIEGKNFPTIPFGDSDNLRLGQWVLAVGNPFNLTGTVTAGIVSAKSRSTAKNSSGGLKVEAFIQTDAAVNKGNSGGALVNAKGELIGINTMIYSETGNYAGYSFAVPINLAAKIVADIKQFGSVQRALLGIKGGDVNAELSKEKDLKVNQGVYVAGFAEISAALAAGVEEGDVIVAINDHRVKTFAELQEQIGRYRPGDKVKVEVNRKGTKKSFTVTLKNQEGGKGVLKIEKINSRLGAKLNKLEAKQMHSYGLSYGIKVEKLSKGALRDAGIKEGFIILTANDHPIRSVEDLDKVFKALKQQGAKTIYLRGFYPSTGDVVGYPISIN